MYVVLLSKIKLIYVQNWPNFLTPINSARSIGMKWDESVKWFWFRGFLKNHLFP